MISQRKCLEISKRIQKMNFCEKKPEASEEKGANAVKSVEPCREIVRIANAVQ